jgi:transcriptional regulator of arginine metabolism
MGRKANSQEDICKALEKQGYVINQSKVSRLLRKIGAIKGLNSQGEIAYSLPREPGPPSMNTPVRQLIIDVAANESLVVISTSPGSASLVSRVLDYHLASIGILGTIAGDDTIFVAPKSTKDIQKVAAKVKSLLMD